MTNFTRLLILFHILFKLFLKVKRDYILPFDLLIQAKQVHFLLICLHYSAQVLDLLKCILLSKTPLTDLFLGEKPSLKRSMFTPGDVIVEDTTNNIQIILKLVVRKSNGKILYAQGDQDFANILLSFLTFPLGGVIRKLGGNSSLGNIDGLYKSIADLDEEKYFTSKEAKNMIVNTN